MTRSAVYAESDASLADSFYKLFSYDTDYIEIYGIRSEEGHIRVLTMHTVCEQKKRKKRKAQWHEITNRPWQARWYCWKKSHNIIITNNTRARKLNYSRCHRHHWMLYLFMHCLCVAMDSNVYHLRCLARGNAAIPVQIQHEIPVYALHNIRSNFLMLSPTEADIKCM